MTRLRSQFDDHLSSASRVAKASIASTVSSISGRSPFRNPGAATSSCPWPSRGLPSSTGGRGCTTHRGESDMGRNRSSRVVAAGVTALMGLALLPGIGRADHTPDPASVTIAGSLQDELGCPGDWQPDCAATHLALRRRRRRLAGHVHRPGRAPTSTRRRSTTPGTRTTAPTPSERRQHRPRPRRRRPTSSSTTTTDPLGHRQRQLAIATAAGSFQSASSAAPATGSPTACGRWMQDPDGDGIYDFATDQIPAGDYEFKVAARRGLGRRAIPAGNVAVHRRRRQHGHVHLRLGHQRCHRRHRPGGTAEPGDELLVRPPVRVDAQDNVFYFVMPDRFDNGDPGNDAGGDLVRRSARQRLRPDRQGLLPRRRPRRADRPAALPRRARRQRDLADPAVHQPVGAGRRHDRAAPAPATTATGRSTTPRSTPTSAPTPRCSSSSPTPTRSASTSTSTSSPTTPAT